MKKLLLISGLLFLGSNFANAQVQKIVGRAGDIEQTTTTTTTINEKGVETITSTTTIKTPCDGTYQDETCATLTDNGQTDPVKGRSYSLEIIGGTGNIFIKGYLKDYFIDDASEFGGFGISKFIFID